MNLKNVVSDDQLGAVITRAIEDEISDIRTAIPCRVKKFDDVKNTVDVDILVDEWIGDKTEKIDTLKELPILMMGNKKLFFTIPIEAGDEGLIIFNDRSIDEHEKGFEEVRDNRNNSISDGVFLPFQLRYKEDLIKEWEKDAITIRGKKPDEARLQLFEDRISAGFVKDKNTLTMKKDEFKILTNDEKTKIEVNKSDVKITINGDIKFEIKDDEIIFHEKVIFKKKVKVETEFEANGKVDLRGVVKINEITQTGN